MEPIPALRPQSWWGPRLHARCRRAACPPSATRGGPSSNGSAASEATFRDLAEIDRSRWQEVIYEDFVADPCSWADVDLGFLGRPEVFGIPRRPLRCGTPPWAKGAAHWVPPSWPASRSSVARPSGISAMPETLGLTPAQPARKRAFDVSLAAVAFVVTAPVCAVAVVAATLDTRQWGSSPGAHRARRSALPRLQGPHHADLPAHTTTVTTLADPGSPGWEPCCADSSSMSFSARQRPARRDELPDPGRTLQVLPTH